MNRSAEKMKGTSMANLLTVRLRVWVVRVTQNMSKMMLRSLDGEAERYKGLNLLRTRSVRTDSLGNDTVKDQYLDGEVAQTREQRQ